MFDEGEVFTVVGKIEIGVKLRPGYRAVLAASEDDEISSRSNGDIGKAPFGEIAGFISEIVAIEEYRAGSRVVNFNPVGVGAIFIGESGVIAGEKFGDDGLAWNRGTDLDVA